MLGFKRIKLDCLNDIGQFVGQFVFFFSSVVVVAAAACLALKRACVSSSIGVPLTFPWGLAHSLASEIPSPSCSRYWPSVVVGLLTATE
jgi:hypothetical protein